MDKNLYLFWGIDSYIIKNKTDQIFSKNNIDEFNVTVYDMEESDIESALNDAATIPFMSDKKAVVVKNAYFLTNEKKPKKEIKHNLDALSRYLDNPSKDSILVFQAPYRKLDERKAITKKLKSKSIAEECTPLKDQDLRNWVKRQLGKNNTTIDTDALNEFMNRVENNTEVLVNEMKKLALYSEDLNRVDIDTIKKVITKNVEDNVYEITNMILENKRSRALEVYNDLISHNEDPLRILGILVNKYREILHTKQLIKGGKDKNDVADYFNATSGRAYYIMKNASSVREDVVEKHLKSLEELDYKIKTGQIDKKIGLELFILST